MIRDVCCVIVVYVCCVMCGVECVVWNVWCAMCGVRCVAARTLTCEEAPLPVVQTTFG